MSSTVCVLQCTCVFASVHTRLKNFIASSLFDFGINDAHFRILIYFTFVWVRCYFFFLLLLFPPPPFVVTASTRAEDHRPRGGPEALRVCCVAWGLGVVMMRMRKIELFLVQEDDGTETRARRRR